MHFQVLVDLGPGVDPESRAEVVERARKLIEPYFAEAPATPWKLYTDAETEGLELTSGCVETPSRAIPA